MDVQLKRGLLELCVLAAIRDGESYGYRMLRDMQPYADLSESTLYPILRRLESAQLLTVRTAEHNGRLRKYYRITPEGLARLEAFRGDWAQMQSVSRFILGEDDHG
jgi:PadR family transcriptional regulator PadR